MSEKINIAELLKDCPSGTELDCTMYDGTFFYEIKDDTIFPICIKRIDGASISLTKYGQYANADYAKCVIFPKGKTTWEGFVPPCKFKDGDIIYNQDIKATAIFCKQTDKATVSHCFLNVIKELKIWHYHSKFLSDWRLATEDEKAKLFQAIKDKGYRWNPDTKTLEKLIEPVFKEGDRISLKCEDIYWDIKTIEGDWYICTNGAKIHIGEQYHYELVPVEPKFKVGDKIKHKENIRWVCTITRVTDRYYVDGHPTCYTVLFDKQDEYELVPNKFDISTLKPFESKVLVRSSKESIWKPAIFGYYLESACYPYYALGGTCWNQCIPYEENEHLLGTTNDCVDYYKTWIKTN